jgi:hypothetical protein
MGNGSNSSQKVKPPKESRKNASISPATRTSNTPQPMGSNLSNERRMFIDLPNLPLC